MIDSKRGEGLVLGLLETVYLKEGIFVIKRVILWMGRI